MTFFWVGVHHEPFASVHHFAVTKILHIFCLIAWNEFHFLFSISSKPLIPPSNPSRSYSLGYLSSTSFNSSACALCSSVKVSQTPSNAFRIEGFFSFSASSNARRTCFRIALLASFSLSSSHSSRLSSHFRSRVMGLSRRFQSSTSTRWRYANESSEVLWWPTR